MRKSYNFLQLPNKFPIQVSLRKVENVDTDWQNCHLILFVLEGNAKIRFQNEEYQLGPNKIIVINPWVKYEIEAEHEIVYLRIKLYANELVLDKNSNEEYQFDCNECNDDDHEKYLILKNAILALIKMGITNKNEDTIYLFTSLAYQILFVLIDQFKVTSNEKRMSEKYFQALKKAIRYIEAHYDEKISLVDVAEHIGYTPQYFSFFFTKHMGQTFQSYYDNFRINLYMHLLKNSDTPLETIASQSGFNDYRSYIRAFKEIYKVTPSQFRKDKKLLDDSHYTDDRFDAKHYLDMILNYNLEHLEPKVKKIAHPIRMNVDFAFKGEPIKKTYLKMIGIDKASDLMKQSVQTMLEQVQKEVGFKYLKFQGIFSDDMHVYRRFVNNQESYSFVFIDQVLDYLRTLNLKPYIQLTYMPRDIAKNPNKIVYESKFVASEPKNIDTWCNLVKEFFYHIINKYTLDEVLTWPISIWNKPDSTIHAFAFENDEAFYEFYQKTFETIKSISPKFNIGSPCLIPFASFANEWDKKFLDFAMQSNCYPDFLSVAYYSNDFDFFITGKKNEKLNKNPDNLKEYIQKIKDPKFYKGDTIYLSEWNLTTNQRNYLNDTIFASCYLTKNILENMDSLDTFSWWSLTDFMDVTQLPNQTYHGGTGLFTYNGICKAPYSALKLLSKLEDTVIGKGPGYYITKNKEKISIIIYNYTHYNDLYADGEYFSINNHSRYEPFNMNNENDYFFKFINLNFNSAKIKITRITQESGSSYDIYEAMSSTDFENIDETIDLKKLSTPKYNQFILPIDNNTLDLKVSVNSLEVKLIEIKLFKNQIK